MGNLIETINQIWELVKEVICKFMIEDLIIKIIPIIIPIIIITPLKIYSRTIGNKTEAQRRKKALKQKENEKTPD